MKLIPKDHLRTGTKQRSLSVTIRSTRIRRDNARKHGSIQPKLIKHDQTSRAAPKTGVISHLKPSDGALPSPTNFTPLDSVSCPDSRLQTNSWTRRSVHQASEMICGLRKLQWCLFVCLSVCLVVATFSKLLQATCRLSKKVT